MLNFATPQYTNLFYIGSAYMVPQHIWSTVSNPSTWNDTNPVGTGPYKLTKFNSQGFTLSKTGTYWQQSQVKIANLSFPSYVSNTTASLALSQGADRLGRQRHRQHREDVRRRRTPRTTSTGSRRSTWSRCS